MLRAPFQVIILLQFDFHQSKDLFFDIRLEQDVCQEAQYNSPKCLNISSLRHDRLLPRLGSPCQSMAVVGNCKWDFFFIPLESEPFVPLLCIFTKWVTHAETWLMWLWLVGKSQSLLLLFLLVVRKGLPLHRLVKADNLRASYSAFHNLEVFGNTNLFWLVHIWAQSFNLRMKYASGNVLSSYL